MPPTRNRPATDCARLTPVPSKTLTSTPGWLSWWVVKTLLPWPGSSWFRSMRRVITPPAVSMPSENGATSNNTKPPSTRRLRKPHGPLRQTRQASSGFSEQFNVAFCELLKNPSSFSRTRGTRVEPPTKTISSTSLSRRPSASFKPRFTDLMDRSNNGSHKLSNFDRVMSIEKSSPLYKASTSILVLVAADQLPLRAVAGEVEAPFAFASSQDASAVCPFSNNWRCCSQKCLACVATKFLHAVGR